MRTTVPSLVFCLVIACTASPGVCEDDTGAAKVPVVFDRRYKMLSADGKEDIGTYHLRATETEKELTLVEKVSMLYNRRTVGWESTVRYRTKPSYVPLSGTAETTIDGKTWMKGTVTFAEKTYDISGRGFLDRTSGEPIDRPREFVKRGIPIPRGTLIFQSALPILAPRLLRKPGELRDIVVVEFPDDISPPELINIKEGYRLVREEADDAGKYRISLFGPHHKRGLSSLQYDRKGDLLAIAPFGKLKLVEVADKN